MFKLGLLDPVQQVDFIAQCWHQKDDSLTDMDACQFLALSMLPKANVAFETLRTPLLLKLLADAVSPSQHNVAAPEDLYEWHVVNFYHKLVEVEYTISPNNPRTKRAFKKKVDYLNQLHTKAAVCALLHRGKCKNLEKEDDILTINECGLAVVTQNFIHFHHSTFAEFLLSCALVAFLQKGDTLSGMSYKAMWRILVADEFKGVRQFLQIIMSANNDYTLMMGTDNEKSLCKEDT